MDLLTVVAHEMGHLLGLRDLDPAANSSSLMAATLGVGVQKVGQAESESSLVLLPVESQDATSRDETVEQSSQPEELTAFDRLAEHQAQQQLASSSLLEVDEDEDEQEYDQFVEGVDELFAEFGEEA